MQGIRKFLGLSLHFFYKSNTILKLKDGKWYTTVPEHSKTQYVLLLMHFYQTCSRDTDSTLEIRLEKHMYVDRGQGHVCEREAYSQSLTRISDLCIDMDLKDSS